METAAPVAASTAATRTPVTQVTTNVPEQTPAPAAPSSSEAPSSESVPAANTQQSNEQLDQLRQMLANVRPAGKYYSPSCAIHTNIKSRSLGTHRLE